MNKCDEFISLNEKNSDSDNNLFIRHCQNNSIGSYMHACTGMCIF